MSHKYPPWVNPFLQHLKTSMNMAESCRVVGVSYSAMQALKLKDGDFQAAVDEAMEEATDWHEAEMRRRAFTGNDEPVIYQGQPTPVFERDGNGKIRVDEDGNAIQAVDANGNPRFVTVRKYSDSLAMFLMKGYRRRVFGDKQEITGANGGALAMVDETKKAARLAALLALAQQRKANELPADDDLSDLA